MQERNLFLFNDLLLIAKERSSSHFKLKDQVKEGREVRRGREGVRKGRKKGRIKERG